jgi:hypothetical protein
MRYLIALGEMSVHQAFVGLGIETAAHSTGVKCNKASSDGSGLDLDDSTVFEAGQPAGRLSAATAEAAQAGLIESGADLDTLRQFMQTVNGSATTAQRDAVIKALIRTTRGMASR